MSYVMVSYCNWSGGTRHYGWDRVTDNFDFICSILDTDDMIVEDYKMTDLLKIIKANPNIKVNGLKIEKGKLLGVLVYPYQDYMEVGDYLLWSYQDTNRGTFRQCRLYKRGCSEQVMTFETPHIEGCYDWKLEDLKLTGDKLNFMVYIDRKYVHKNEFECQIDVKSLRLLKFPEKGKLGGY